MSSQPSEPMANEPISCLPCKGTKSCLPYYRAFSPLSASVPPTEGEAHHLCLEAGGIVTEGVKGLPDIQQVVLRGHAAARLTLGELCKGIELCQY